MDFFQRQDTARRSTKLLEVYFTLAVVGTILLVYLGLALVVIVSQSQSQSSNEQAAVSLWDPELFVAVTLGTLLVIGLSSLYKISQLSRGGSVVAEMLGGQPVSPHTTDFSERKLINVVEEMSIASGTPVPQLYLLPDQEVINAFAAGHTTGDMVICVTRGALKYLTRDELQGVIGHEFSHILNGDMRLNIRLMGIVFGILCLTIIGKILLQTRGGKKNPLPIIGIVLLIVGGIGVFFGKLIKSAVSRQREFLADAASVQFTRNPEGLASALKKVGSSGSLLDDPNAEDASHFFFANGLRESLFGWMSTHPPLEQRIRQLDPQWDGKFIPLHPVRNEAAAPAKPPPPPTGHGVLPLQGNLIPGLAFPAAAIASAAVLSDVGAPTGRHLDYAADVMANINDSLRDAARSPMSAVALIYALLLSPDETVRTAQLQQLQSNPIMAKETERLSFFTKTLDSRARLPLATLSITALRSLSADQYAQFAANIQSINGVANQTNLFAYVLQKSVLRRLDSQFNPPKPKAPQFYAIKPLLPDCAVLLSALACAGQVEPADVEKAFSLGADHLDDPSHVLQLDTTAYDLTKIDAALERLNQAAPQIKKAILSACAETVAADGVIEENEAELLRAIADTLDCPIPPFINV